VKRILVGRPLATGRLSTTLLPKRLALPIFSSDAISSVAYASEAALVVLVGASASSTDLLVPISVAIAALLVLVVLSYRQTVDAYPSGGGSYVVARENLGELPGLIAAASLLTDYVLTVAVSIAAGVVAITSATTDLGRYAVPMSLAFLVLLTAANIRGAQEAGRLFALPTYGFIVAVGVMLLVGAGDCLTGGCPTAHVPDPDKVGAAASISVAVGLRAFASGCSALTGVEAIANGIGAFKPPKSRNAGTTLLIMGAIAVVLFMGVSALAAAVDARPSGSESVLSQIAHAVFGDGVGYFMVQAFTFAILVLAANTAFQGFPRLAAVLARDGFMPRPFLNLGDRLVYSNGIVVLAGVAGALLIAFQANVNSLLHLWLVGVFTAFTLSQAGMIRHWRTHPGAARHRAWRMAINGVGAVGTALVTVLIVATKFGEGAWMVVIAVPLIVLAQLALRRHYRRAWARLHTGVPDIRSATRSGLVLPVAAIDQATMRAWSVARRLNTHELHAVHAGPRDAELATQWQKQTGAELELIDSPEGAVASVARYVRDLHPSPERPVNVMVPELFERRSLRAALRRTGAFQLTVRLMEIPDVAVTHVPALASHDGAPATDGEAAIEALLFVADTGDMTALGLAFARGLGAERVRAVHVALDAERAKRLSTDWERTGSPVALEIVDAPFRSLEGPVLNTVRGVTSRPGSLAVVVLPELATDSWWRDALHNERAVYLTWLLLFEPRVVVAAVPLHRRLG